MTASSSSPRARTATFFEWVSAHVRQVATDADVELVLADVLCDDHAKETALHGHDAVRSTS